MKEEEESKDAKRGEENQEDAHSVRGKNANTNKQGK